MTRKRKGVDVTDEQDAVCGPKPKHSRASPLAVVKLYEFFSKDQKDAVAEMEFESLLDIKCPFLHNPLIGWFASMYDKHTHEFVIPARGRISLDDLSVFRTIGLPIGTDLSLMLSMLLSRKFLALSCFLKTEVHRELFVCLRF